jgi:hypothetical protein
MKMTEAQAKAVIEQVTGYSVEEKPVVALDMAQRIAKDIAEAIVALGGIPAVAPIDTTVGPLDEYRGHKAR